MLYQFLGRVEEENDSKWKMGNWRSVSLGVVELKDEGGEGRSALRGGDFYHPPLALTFTFSG